MPEPLKTRLNLEYHVAHACNLRCHNCSHYSDLGTKGWPGAAEADGEFALWAGRLLPRRLALLGGEPTLNKELPAILRAARRRWPVTPILLVTNGWFLHRQPELPAALRATGAFLDISVHHEGQGYQEKVREIEATVERDYGGVPVRWRPSYARWRRWWAAPGPAARPVPLGDGRPERAYEICHSRTCLQLFQGHLWKCPQVAYFRLAAARRDFGDAAWDEFRRYRPLGPEAGEEELAEFLARGAEPACGVCPSEERLFTLNDPRPGAGG